jgi:hypothetical protein
VTISASLIRVKGFFILNGLGEDLERGLSGIEGEEAILRISS